MAQGVGLSGLTCPQCRWEPVLGTLCWVAILSRTFEEEGWRTLPPIDIVHTKAFNLLDPGFFMVVLDLILEG